MSESGQRLRIALISSSFHPYTGGVEQHVRQVARELQRSGHDVVVWTVDRGEQLGLRDVDGIEVRYLPTPLPARDLRSLGRFARALPQAAREWWCAHRDFRPDLLHVQCFGPNGVYALGLHLLTGTPLVVTSHGETFADDHGAFEGSALLRGALRQAISSASLVTGPSQFVLDDLRVRFGLNGGHVVPNGVYLDEPMGEAPQLPSGLVVFGIGRVERMKGFDLLLDAMAQVDVSDVQVVIAGDGAELDNIRAQARELRISERVHFLGRLSPNEVSGAMRAADVVVVPSRQEAFGIVALEAWRAGTPLVASSRGGMAEFITDGEDGLIVDPADQHALTGAIRRLLTNSDLAHRLSAAGCVRVVDFGWEAVAARYLDLYPVKKSA